ncbi:MAG: nucleoside deaminase [Clostridia bacterium]|nr:nucleoside deaminase [Clostridia bacterium]
MELAIAEAQKALEKGEIPVGAVVVCGNEVISAAHNLKETLSDVTAHAEILAIREAEQKKGDWRLQGCDLYVTLEPCPMCAEAIRQSRLRRLYFGAYDTQNGAAGSKFDIIGNTTEIYGGICEDECTAILTGFFKNRRAE